MALTFLQPLRELLQRRSSHFGEAEQHSCSRNLLGVINPAGDTLSTSAVLDHSEALLHKQTNANIHVNIHVYSRIYTRSFPRSRIR